MKTVYLIAGLVLIALIIWLLFWVIKIPVWLIVGLIAGGLIVWFFKPQLIKFWQWATPYIKRGEAAAITAANEAIGRK
jgi:hypothetical protein